MRSWQALDAGPGLAAVVLATGLSAVGRGAGRGRGEQHEVPAERR